MSSSTHSQRSDPTHATRQRSATSSLSSAVRLMRPLQWVKNVLVFAPLLLAQQMNSLQAWLTTGRAFIAFSLVASAVYVLNDFLDVEADRSHASKSRRPFASGELALSWALPLFAVLLSIGFLVSATLPGQFLLAMLIYLLATSLYSLWLKGQAILDVLVLAGLYTLRLVAGGVANGIVVSDWLLAMSVFFFSSLAFAKRYTELARLEKKGEQETLGRGYRVEDLSLIESLGTTSGYIAVLVLALYIRSETANELYSQRWALWLVCPILLYWLGRIWLKAKRRELDDDPVVFALRDGASLCLGGLAVALVVAASMNFN